jgi:hypothetical protein
MLLCSKIYPLFSFIVAKKFNKKQKQKDPEDPDLTEDLIAKKKYYRSKTAK